MHWAVLLRGVNVSGTHKLPMPAFRSLLAGLGCQDPVTHIQSGNAVVTTDQPPGRLAPAITEAIRAAHGFAPETYLRGLPDLQAALDHPWDQPDGSKVHAFFLADPAALPDQDVIARVKAASEDWRFRPGLFLLHAPDGIGRSVLANKLHKVVAGSMTARNLNTVAALARLIRERDLSQP